MGNDTTIRNLSEIHKEEFDILMGVKKTPNEREIELFHRTEKYIQKLTWIPGIEMIAVVNSLSMYATHEDSDIDLFIVTEPGMIWFVRFCVTIELYLYGVWRHGKDIRGNFCLSFFVTTEALHMEEIAIENDIYLYYWVSSMKLLYERDTIYEEFLNVNNWVDIPPKQREENQKFLVGDFQKKQSSGILLYFLHEVNNLIRFFLLPYSLRSWKKSGSLEGVIISDTMLKFHDQDRRQEVRDTILNTLTE